jgi:hypothetical protein
MEIEIPPKWIWGKRKKRKIWMLRWPFSAIRNSNHPVRIKINPLYIIDIICIFINF